MQTTIPQVLRALHEALTDTLPDLVVSLGVPTDTSGTDGLYLGVSDPYAPTLTSGVTGSQTYPHATAHSRQEDYTISCVAESWDGAGDSLAAMDGAFTTFTAAAGLVRSTPTLGVAGVLLTMADRVTLDAGQVQAGAVAQVGFTITCKSRI